MYYFLIKIKTKIEKSTKITKVLISLDMSQSRSRSTALHMAMETKLRYLNCPDQIFKSVKIFSIAATNFLKLSRFKLSIET
jgi:hypothetical protein